MSVNTAFNIYVKSNFQILKTSYSTRSHYLWIDIFLITGNTKQFPKKPFVVSPAEMLQIINEMKSQKSGIFSEPTARYGKKQMPH